MTPLQTGAGTRDPTSCQRHRPAGHALLSNDVHAPDRISAPHKVELHRDNRMSDYTPEELRTFPAKERWTPEESLATIEQVDGFDCIHGACLPFYVQTREDRVRWANCVRVAAQVFGAAVASPVVQQAARLLFADRETYTD